MKRSKKFFLSAAAFFLMSVCFNAWAVEMGTIQSAKALDGSQSVFQIVLDVDGATRSCRVDNETMVVLRVPADRIVKGDRIWINQNVTGIKGTDASISLSPAASKWFGIPRINKVPKVPSFQKVPEVNTEDEASGMVDGNDQGAETIVSVEKTSKGVTLITAGGKERTFPQGQRLWKVVSPSGLRSGMVVKADIRSGNRLKQLWVGSSN